MTEYQHPLTDEICDQIQDSIHPCDPANMRAAADWQLEECVEELKCLLSVFAVRGLIKNAEEVVPIIVKLFESHMRPQQQESN